MGRGGWKKQGVEREQGEEKEGKEGTLPRRNGRAEMSQAKLLYYTGTNCFNEKVGAAVSIKFHCERGSQLEAGPVSRE